MNTSDHELLKTWKGFSIDSPPYVLPADKQFIPDKKICLFSSYEKYYSSSSFRKKGESALHLGLIPVPYMGNLNMAKVFILSLNPGLSPVDYFAEDANTDFKKAIIKSLHQDNENDDYPNLFLNPHFSWHSGFDYWEGKIKEIALDYANRKGISYQESLMLLSKNIACFELCPYHSLQFGMSSIQNKLASVRIMLDYVNDILVPRAKAGQIIIIVTRGIKSWNLHPHENIIIYNPKEARSASLSLKSPGGQAIARHLSLI